MQWGSRLTLFLLACGLMLPHCMAAMPAPKPRAGGGTKSPVLEMAVAALKNECGPRAKGAAPAPLRTACDYFSGDKAADIPVDALLAALEKPLAGADARQNAYVKWQLLSALPETLEDPVVERLLKVYQRAPAPAPRFGCTPREQKEMDKMLSGARPQDDVHLTDKLDEAVNRGFEADRAVIAYRDELYKRLPAGKDKFVTALRDAAERVRVAAQKDALGEALSKDLPGWALTVDDGDRTQVREVAELVGQLRLVESPPYYKSAGVRRGKLTWITDTDTLQTTKKLATLHKLLLDVAGVEKPDPAAGGPKTRTNGPRVK